MISDARRHKIREDADHDEVSAVCSGHLQTMYCVVGNFNIVDKVVYERTLLRVRDGGTM
jgi:predicted alpha/beta-fold hydrolase